jgi:hypothetical protein
MEVATARHRDSPRKGVVVTFFVHASKEERVTMTARLSVVIAVTKGRSLLADGWDVFIIGPDGSRYDPVDFDRLFEIEPDARTET